MSRRKVEGTAGKDAGRRRWTTVARGIVWLRFLIVPIWVALAVAATLGLPSLFDSREGSIGDLLPANSRALSAEKSAERTFGVPLLTRTVVVASQPGGLSRNQVANATRFIAEYDQRVRPSAPLRGAFPLANVPRLATQTSAGRTLVAFAFVDPGLSLRAQTAVTSAFARHLRVASGIANVDVGGPIPARYEDAQISDRWLQWVEIATIVLVVGILAFYFRAVGIPLLGLATVAIAYLCASHLLGWLAEHGSVAAPQEVEPVIVALLFGVLTDYVVFFVAAYRHRLEEGRRSREAATLVTAELLPVVVTAGLMISGAMLTLLLSGVRFLSLFGPGMAIAVAVGVAVSLTFVPAVLAMIGPLLLRPGRPPSAKPAEPRTPRGRVVGLTTRFPALVAIICILLLGAAASGIRHLELGDPVMRGLPSSSSARRAYDSAARAFGPGILSPTMVMVRGPGVSRKRAQLARLQVQMARIPNVSAVFGPADQPFERPYGIVLAPGGDAARFIVAYGSDPEGAAAARTLDSIQDRMPKMLESVGLPRARVEIAGDTALTTELTTETDDAFLRVTPAALALLAVLLWALLRSRTAPIYLVAVSALVVAAALGLTVYVFQSLLGYGELAFFVPIASAILLLALGSDYNVFLVGRIWREAERRHLRAAVRTAGSRAARTITLAGMILALSFAAIAIIPVLAFREVAFMMAVGLFLDAFVARTLLIPALITLLGRGTDRGSAGRTATPAAAEATAAAGPRGGQAA